MSIDPVNPYAAPLVGQVPEPLPKPAVTIGSILSLGWRLYFTNLAAVVIVTTVVWAPLKVFQAYMEYFVFDPEDFRDSFRLEQFLDGVFGVVATAGVIAIGGGAMRGERVSWWGGLEEGLVAWPRMIWTRIVYGFALVLALLALIVPALYFGVRLMLIDQVTVLEGESGGESIAQSYKLTAGAFWRLVGLWLLTTAMMIVAAIVISIPLIFFPEIDHWLLSAATSMIVQLLMPLQTLVFVAAYFAADEQLTNSMAREFALGAGAAAGGASAKAD